MNSLLFPSLNNVVLVLYELICNRLGNNSFFKDLCSRCVRSMVFRLDSKNSGSEWRVNKNSKDPHWIECMFPRAAIDPHGTDVEAMR